MSTGSGRLGHDVPTGEQIEQAAAEQAEDLLAYYDGPDEVREHLVSIIPSVAVQDGKLCRLGRPSRTGRTCLEHQWNALSGTSRASIRMVGAKDLSRGILKWMEAF